MVDLVAVGQIGESCFLLNNYGMRFLIPFGFDLFLLGCDSYLFEVVHDHHPHAR